MPEQLRLRSVVASLVLGATLGWYLALFVVVVVMGNDAFNAAFPNPWRLLIAVPSLVAVAAWWSMP